MPQVKRLSMAEQAAELLLGRVRDGEWELGQKLPGEVTLASQMGVGRSTAREAIRILAGKGVLASRQGSGVYLTALDVREEWDAVLGRAEIRSVIEARTAIETEAARLAALRRSPAELRAVRRALDDRAARRDGLEDHVDADTAFHRSIVLASGNPVLTGMFDRFTPRMREAMVEMLRRRGEFGEDEDQQAHADMVEAVAAKDPEAAARLSREHLAALAAGLE